MFKHLLPLSRWAASLLILLIVHLTWLKLGENWPWIMTHCFAFKLTLVVPCVPVIGTLTAAVKSWKTWVAAHQRFLPNVPEQTQVKVQPGWTLAQLFAVFLCARLNEFETGACVFALHIYWCVFFHRVFAQSQLRQNICHIPGHTSGCWLLTGSRCWFGYQLVEFWYV